jgi:hypothetical protein
VSQALNLKAEMAEGESAAVIGPTRLPASRVASSYRCNRCEPERLVEPSTTPSSSLSIPVSRLNDCRCVWKLGARFLRRLGWWVLRDRLKPGLQNGEGWFLIEPELRDWKPPIRHLHWGSKTPQFLPGIALIRGLRAAKPWNRKRGRV